MTQSDSHRVRIIPPRRTRRRHTVAALLASLGLVLGGLVAAAPPAHALPCDRPHPVPAGGQVPASDYYPQYSRTAADQGEPITPDESIARAFDWIDQSLSYCQSHHYPDRHGTDYRTDCSGSISMAWHANSSYTTHNILEISDQIPWSDLQPGDGVLRDGHVEMVTHVEGDTVKLFSFGSTPARETTHTRHGVQVAYSTAIRYENMQVITDEMVRDTIENDLDERSPGTRPTINPDAQTLVNFDTVFSTDAPPYRETIELAGIPVDLAADPTTFDWDFDDGDTHETTHPGLPWSEENESERAHQLIHHDYTDTGNYQPLVDITWTNYRYRLPGEAWQPVDGDITLTSPTTPIDVIETESVLTQN